MKILKSKQWLYENLSPSLIEFLSLGFKGDYINTRLTHEEVRIYDWKNVLGKYRFEIIFFPEGQEIGKTLSPRWEFFLYRDSADSPDEPAYLDYGTSINYDEGALKHLHHSYEFIDHVPQSHLARCLLWLGFESGEIREFFPATHHEFLEWGLERNELFKSFSLDEIL